MLKILAIGLVLVAAERVVAADVDVALSGLANMKIIIEQLDEDAAQCGISSDALDSALRIPLSGTTLLDKPSPSVRFAGLFAPSIYANVNVLRINNSTCVAAVSVRVNRVMNFGTIQDPKPSFVGVWNRSVLLTGGQSDFGLRVTNQVEGLSKQFIGAWLRSN